MRPRKPCPHCPVEDHWNESLCWGCHAGTVFAHRQPSGGEHVVSAVLDGIILGLVGGAIGGMIGLQVLGVPFLVGFAVTGILSGLTEMRSVFSWHGDI